MPAGGGAARSGGAGSDAVASGSARNPSGYDAEAARAYIFDTTRTALLKEAASVGVMHRSVRMRRLERLADRAEAMGNIALAAKILEQAAREMGGAFTNKVAIGGDAEKGPVQMVVTWKSPMEQGG